MLNLTEELKQTRFYQEIKQEGIEVGREAAKLEAIPRMVNYGLNAETIAQLLNLPLEFVQQTITQSQNESTSVSEINDESQSS